MADVSVNRLTCAVVPSYNAAETIAPLIHQARQLGLDVVVVNDGSTDQTARVAMEAGATVISHLHNRGKGLALRTGFAFALQSSYERIVTLDSDGQHDPSDIPLLLAALEADSVGVVVGHRLAYPGRMPWIRRVTNRAMSLAVSWLTRQPIPDSQCGFRAVRRKVLESVALSACRFDLETELVLAASRAGWSIVSVPVRSIYRHHRSYIHPLLDGLRFVRLIGRYLRP